MIDKAKSLPDKDPDTLMSPRDIAGIIGVSRRMVIRWCEQEKLNYSRVGNLYYVITWRDFVRFWDDYTGYRKRHMIAELQNN